MKPPYNVHLATTPICETSWNLPLVILALRGPNHDIVHGPLHARTEFGTEWSEVLFRVACWHAARQAVFDGFVNPDNILQ